MNRVVLLDTDAARVQLCSDNALVIPEWDGNPDDTTLVELVPFFQSTCLSFLWMLIVRVFVRWRARTCVFWKL